MSQATAMRLIIPKDADKPEDQNKAKQSGVITILLGKDNHVFYYEGELDNSASNFKSSNFHDIRDILMKKKNSVAKLSDYVVIIKPSDQCTYRNVIDILDEMTITVSTRYALVDISAPEAKLVEISDQTTANN
jgi:hypothetical protein